MTHKYSLDAMDVLVIIDVQNDFCPGGALGVTNGDEVVPVINALSRTFDHVIATQDWHPTDHTSFASRHPGKAPFNVIDMPYGQQVLWPDHCVKGTQGADFHPDLDLSDAELIVRKGYRRDIDSYSAFYENDQVTPTGLAGCLRERELKRVFLCGLATDFCVLYSALDACREGFETIVIEDACRAIDLEGSLATSRQNMLDVGVNIVDSLSLRD